MPRPEDIAWKFVVRLDGKRWRCPYCHKVSAGSVTRVKGHFLKQPKEGIAYCTKVPEHIRMLMELLLNHEVFNKDDIAWKFVDRVEDSKWRCYYCSGEFFGDLTGVKGHLLGLPNEGISICTGAPEHVRMLMRSLLDEEAEEESREVGEEPSGEAHGQSSMEPKSGDMPTQDEVAEEEIRDANSQFVTELEGNLLSLEFPSAESPSSYAIEQMALQLRTVINTGVNSDQQSQPERQFHESSTMPSLEQNSLCKSTSCSTEASGEDVLYFLASPHQPPFSSPFPCPEEMPMNGQQIPTGTSSFQYNQLPATGNSHCLQDSNQHSQLQIPMDIDSSFASQHTIDSHVIWAKIVGLQIPEVATNTTGPSSSQGNSNLDCNQPRISSVTSVTNSVPHSNQPLPSCDEECGTETSSFPLRDSRGICAITAIRPTRSPHIEATHVNLQVLEDGTNMAGPSPSQVQPALVSPQHQSVPHQAPNIAPSPPQIQCCGTGLIGPSSLPELDMNKDAPSTSHINTNDNFEKRGALKRKINRLYSREADIRDELDFAASSLSLKKQRMEVKNWLADVEKLRNDFRSIEATSEDCLPSHQQVDTLMQEVEDLMEQGNFPKGLFVVRETKGNKLLERKLVGEAFQRSSTKILEYLVGNQISRLGIYGMGGVGKTTLMVHIHNRLLEKANFDNVLWITVSQDFNTQKLQDDIWGALNLGILQEKDVRKRAAMLSNGLTKRENLIIILDDVWERFDLEEVGIPTRANGLKLVLTTRSYDVCRQMHCQENIKIEPLSQEEAESLFFDELGSERALDLGTKAIVKCVIKECAGLPLGIIMMAASMRGVTDVFEWKDCLEKLEESDMQQMEMEKVLKILKFSYDRLRNREAQQCFLSCALYPEDKLIDKVELIEFFIDQGLICGLNAREKQYDRGFTILNKLENVCLLEDHGEWMKMHDLIRDMALHIMSASSIVKAGKGLTRIPPEEYWTNALEKVSLMENEISEFPLNMSPNCPKLSTLLLNGCLSRNVGIPDSFFKNLLGLKVLNLSKCDMRELPNSILDLVNLRALLLRECRTLQSIPSLEKLTSLRKLDTRSCGSLKALEGLEKLVNLRYLDLTETCIERLPKGILEHLLNLQYLKVPVVIEEDITKLGALETFECYLKNANDFNECVRVIEQGNNPRYYDLSVISKSRFIVKVSDDARFGDLGRGVDIRNWGHAIVGMGEECTGIFILIPRDVQRMTIENCDGITNLFGMDPLEHLEELKMKESENLGVLSGGHDEEIIKIPDFLTLTPTALLLWSLRVLKISYCPKLKYLFGHGSKSNLPHLREICISQCEEMVGIIAAVTSPPPHPLPFFPSLEKISVKFCGKMKRAVESEWMPHFPKLRRIKVSFCEKMEEIIGGPPPYLPVEDISLESLEVGFCNNMRKLFPHEWLLHLQNLQSIDVGFCNGMVEMISRVGQGQEESIMAPVNSALSSFQPPISLPKLEWLGLRGLLQLKSIFEVPISCDSMKELIVYGCPELKRIPLQLQLREIEELPHIRVEDEEKWKTLMWDHPDAQAILRPYLRKGEDTNKASTEIWIPIPPNAIELSAKGMDLLQLCS